MSTAGFNRTLAQPTHDDMTWAMMAYLGQFVLSALAPAIVFMARRDSLYVRRHAVQALNLGLSVIAVWLVGGLLSLAATVLLLVPIAFTVAATIFLIRAAGAANRMGFLPIPAVLAWPIVK
jgi:uncharacterized Tic20 family protein